MIDNQRKDFFISYNGEDEEKATWIAEVLERNGYHVVIQAWDFRPGSNFVLEMNNALKLCDRVIAVLSNNYLQSNFTPSEWAEAFRRDPKGENSYLIPIYIEDNLDTRGLLGPIVGIKLHDFLDPNDSVKLNKAEKMLIEKLSKPERKSKLSISVPDLETMELIIEIDENGEIVCTKDSVLSITKWIAKYCLPNISLRIIDRRVIKANDELHAAEEIFQNTANMNELVTKRLIWAQRNIDRIKFYSDTLEQNLRFFAEINYKYSYIDFISANDFIAFAKVLQSYIEDGKSEKMNKGDCVSIDFTLNVGINKNRYYFVVPLKKADLLLTGISDNLGFYDVALLDYRRFAKEARQEIVAVFCNDYKMMFSRGQVGLKDDGSAQNLDNYRIGLH